jgi:hypothetical protein
MSTENQINPLQALIMNNKVSKNPAPFAPAMMDIQDEVAERVNIPRPEKVTNTGYGFFPTGGQNMFGMESWDLPDKWVTGLGLLAGMAGPEGKKQAANKILKFSTKELAELTSKLKGKTKGAKGLLSDIQKGIDSQFTPVDENVKRKVIDSFGTTENIMFDPSEVVDIYKTANKINQSITVPGTRGINLRREFYPNVYTGEAGVTYFGGNKKVPMLDIDLPEPKGGLASHAADQMPHNFQTHQDVYDHLDKMFDTPYMADASFRAYNTKAGVRLFDVGNRMTPLQYLMLTRYTNLLKSDPRYVGKSVVNFNPKQLSLNFKNRFDYRLSPKPGRVEPTIADYVGTLGPGRPNPKSVSEVTQYHDDAIQVLQEFPEARYSLSGLLGYLGKLPQ